MRTRTNADAAIANGGRQLVTPPSEEAVRARIPLLGPNCRILSEDHCSILHVTFGERPHNWSNFRMSAAFPSLLVAESVTREAWQRSQIEMQPIQLCHFEATLANNRIEARRPLHHMDGL